MTRFIRIALAALGLSAGSTPWFHTSTSAKFTLPPPWERNPLGTT